ncbi:hypothetical protein D9758_011542 [Tetrapyrgos nigripes]|uniref:DUF6699 domain-containing protein n=1 Tax=Tetrapyrgos nigripes TaxID=182062 RepID=A0A8H5FQ98_9AGAR|nr:hypothetical protein D9758_011542 [Tetrapyrgos nigripes]
MSIYSPGRRTVTPFYGPAIVPSSPSSGSSSGSLTHSSRPSSIYSSSPPSIYAPSNPGSRNPSPVSPRIVPPVVPGSVVGSPFPSGASPSVATYPIYPQPTPSISRSPSNASSRSHCSPVIVPAVVPPSNASSRSHRSPVIVPAVVPPTISSISSVRSESVSPSPEPTITGAAYQDFLSVPRGDFPGASRPRSASGGSPEIFIPPLPGEEPSAANTPDPVPIVDPSQAQSRAQAHAAYSPSWSYGAYPPTPYSPYHNPYYPPVPYPSAGAYTPHTPFTPFTPFTPHPHLSPYTQVQPPPQPFGISNVQNTPFLSTPAMLPGMNGNTTSTPWFPNTPLQPSFPFFPNTPHTNNLNPNLNTHFGAPAPLVYGPATPPILLHPHLTPGVLNWDLLHHPTTAKYTSQWGAVKSITDLLGEEAITMLPIPTQAGVRVTKIRITASSNPVLSYWLPIWTGGQGIRLPHHKLADILQVIYEFLHKPLTPEETNLLLGTPGNVFNAREAKRRRAREGMWSVAGAVEGEEGYRRMDCLGVLRGFGGFGLVK